MSEPQEFSGKQSSFLINALHVFVLFSFAVAQPIYDLLSRHAEFLVAHQAKPIDVIILIIFLSFAVPFVIVAFEAIAGLLGRKVRKGIHGLVILIFITVFAIQLLKHINQLSGMVIVIMASILGIASTFFYFRFHVVRFFFTILSPAILIFPLLLLFNSPVNKIVFEKNKQYIINSPVNSDTPVIMVVFDEFSTISLMDENYQIDPVRYPNFAELAKQSYWFRNNTTVAEMTDSAVPAILTGSYVDHYLVPTVNEHPCNIFTLLGGSYEIKAIEPMTLLCPDELCKNKMNSVQRIRSVGIDLLVVCPHIIFPSDLLSWLPPVTQTWEDFLGDAKMFASKKEYEGYVEKTKPKHKDRVRIFREFVNSIGATDKPTLYFIHSILPHVPWDYFPSGRQYAESGFHVPGLDIKMERWSNNEALVLQGYQRHLLQAGFTDKLLGELITHLKEIGIFDRSLIVITADHGVSFWPNKQRRNIKNGHPPDILLAPLLIKVPYQKEGVISDRNVQSIDILPTIADVLDIQMPCKVDGHSALDESLSENTEKIIYNPFYEKFVFDVPLKGVDISLQRKLAIFGSGTTRPDGIYKYGKYCELIGRNVNEIGIIGDAPFKVKIDNEFLFANVLPKAEFIPAFITGQIVSEMRKIGRLPLVIAINNRIAAVSEIYEDEKQEKRFSFSVPESVFHEGNNEVEVLMIQKNKEGEIQLLNTRQKKLVTYSLSSNTLISSKGTSLKIVPNAIQGAIDNVELKNDEVIFYGWAAEVKQAQPPDEIVIFVNGKFFYSGKCNANRPDVVNHFHNQALMKSGFFYVFSSMIFDDKDNADVRIFAISNKGFASELASSLGYKGIKKFGN